MFLSVSTRETTLDKLTREGKITQEQAEFDYSRPLDKMTTTQMLSKLKRINKIHFLAGVKYDDKNADLCHFETVIVSYYPEEEKIGTMPLSGTWRESNHEESFFLTVFPASSQWSIYRIYFW
jgi:hypothetical protein